MTKPPNRYRPTDALSVAEAVFKPAPPAAINAITNARGATQRESPPDPECAWWEVDESSSAAVGLGMRAILAAQSSKAPKRRIQQQIGGDWRR